MAVVSLAAEQLAVSLGSAAPAVWGTSPVGAQQIVTFGDSFIAIGSIAPGGDEHTEQSYQIRPTCKKDTRNWRLYSAEVLPAAANKRYENPRVQEWSRTIDACDAFVFITPEYNHSVPGAMKNAVDCLGSEWRGKPLGFVGYSASGGIRAVEHWRAIMANFECPMLRTQLSLSIFDDVQDGVFTPGERQAASLDTLLGELERAARAA